MPVGPAPGMPVPPTVHPADAIRGPDDDMRQADPDLLLATRAAVSPGCPRAGDLAHEPVATGIRLSARDPAGDAPQVQGRVIATAAVGAGHAP